MRKSKTVGNANTLTQVWNGDEIELELNGNQLVSNYVHGDKLICGTYGWYQYNAHGDVTALTDSTGTVTKTYDYNAFGIEDGGTPNDNNPYRYSGEYYDKESGYTYLQARYYDAENGRFVSEDPAEDGDNWYVYCGNDPINMIDPTGMWSGTIHEEITEKAYNKVKPLKHMKKEWLIESCTLPDRNATYKMNHKYNKYHGHKNYYKVIKQCLSGAIILKQNKQYKSAAKLLGIGLHTIQDFYSHNVKVEVNGKYKAVNSRKYANKQFIIKDNELKVPKKYKKYFSTEFLKNANSHFGIVDKINNLSLTAKQKSKLLSIHAATADNPNAYFSSKKNQWVWIDEKNENKKYKRAKKESKKFLNKYKKNNAQSYRLSIV